MNKNGNIIVSFLFTLVVFLISLTLLMSNLEHMNIIKVRNAKVEGIDVLSRDMDFYLHQFKLKILNKDLKEFDNPEIDYFNNQEFSSCQINDSIITNKFNFHKVKINPFYEEVKVFNQIEGYLNDFPYIYLADVLMKIVKGEIPVLFFSLLINQDVDVGNIEYLLHERIKVNEKFLLRSIEWNYDLTGFLIESLNLDSNQLSWGLIRKNLGLNIQEEAIDDGIYLILGDGKIHSIFIQGDVEQIRFSTISPFLQIINIRQNNQETRVCYQPKCFFLELKNNGISQSNIIEDRIFSEVIVINGSVHSIVQEGIYAFLKDSDIILYISKNAIIHSSLISEPESKRSNFTIINVGHEFFKKKGDNKIKLMVNDGEEININASIISTGVLENHSEVLNLSGNLITEDLINKGEININKKTSNKYLNKYFKTEKLKFIYSIMINRVGEKYFEE